MWLLAPFAQSEDARTETPGRGLGARPALGSLERRGCPWGWCQRWERKSFWLLAAEALVPRL